METDMGGTAIFVKVKGDKYARRGLDAEELKRDSCCCGATKTHPCACMIQGIMKCSATCPCSLEKNWGGDPKGKLAQALAKAREKANEPKKPLKIEKLDAEEFDRAIEDKKGHINYWNEKDRMQKYFKNWKPKSSPYEKRVVAETKTKWCENCGELDDNEEENWPWYQWVLKQKNSSKANFRWITGGACGGCGSDLCQNCLDGNTSGNFNPLFEPTCEDCGSAFCKECKDEDEDRCNTCQEEYEENVCDCCGYLHHAEGCEFNAPTKGIDTFTKPFEESSLDSGTVKSIVVGLGIGALALFGYNKWK
jgi:hypothetical protein